MPASESRRVDVGRGLHVFRYVASGSPERPPHAKIAPTTAGDGLTIVAAPGNDGLVLAAPGSAVVLVAEQPSSFNVEVVSAGPDGSLDARLQLETLSSAVASETDRGRMRPVGRPSSLQQEQALRITGHVARRGDITVVGGEWLAGPDAPSPIEGLIVDASGGEGQIGLEYQVLAREALGQWSPWVRAGVFVGSRGRAVPICGVRLRLLGGGELDGQALFLGAPVVRGRGSVLDFVSPAGSDPLVGLKIAIVPSARSRRHAAEIGRVRIFRAASSPPLRESA